MASDYVRGEMDITDQKDTFDGFMAVSVWGSLITGLSVLYLTLVFAVGFDWFASAIGVAIVGALLGAAVGLKTSWYVTVGAMFVLTLVTGGIVKLFGAFIGG